MDDASKLSSDNQDPKQVNDIAMKLLAHTWTDSTRPALAPPDLSPAKKETAPEIQTYSLNLGPYKSDSELNRQVIEMLANKMEPDGKNGMQGAARPRVEELAKASTDLSEKELEKLAAANSQKDPLDRKAAALFFSASANKSADQFWMDAIGLKDGLVIEPNNEVNKGTNNGITKGTDGGTDSGLDYKDALVNKLAAAQLSDFELANAEKNRHIATWQDSAREKFGDAAGVVSTVAVMHLVAKLPGLVKLPGLSGLALTAGSAMVAGGLVNNEVAGRSALAADGYLNNFIYSGMALGLSSAVGRATERLALSPQNNVRIAAGLFAVGRSAYGGLELEKANVYQNAWDPALIKADKLRALETPSLLSK